MVASVWAAGYARLLGLHSAHQHPLFHCHLRRQEDVPVGVRARAAAENGLADGGAEAASPIKPAAQQAAAAAQRPAQRRKPATAGGGSKSKAARSQAQEEDDDEEESDAEQHWRPVKRSRRELKVAAAPAVQPLPALPLAEVGLPQLLPGAQLQELDLWQAQAHATAQQVAQQEADAIWAHVAGQTVQVAVEAPPAASALRQQHHDEEMHEADSDEDEVAELLGMLRHRSPARAPMGERTAPAAAAAGSVGDSATQREPVPAPPVTEQQQQQQHDDAVKEEQLPVLSEQQPQVAAAGEAAGQPPAAAPGGEEQQPAPEQQPCLKSTGAEGQAAEQQQQQQQLAEPAPSSQALAAVGQGSLGADQATAAASKHELGQQERDQRLFYYDAAAENVEKEVAALEAEVEVAADAHLAPFTAPLGEELALALEATPPGSPRHTAAVPTVGSPTEQQGGAAGQAPGDASACASAANGDAGSLSPQMAAVKASATQHMLQRAVESFQCADIASSESMLLPLRRLQCVGKGGAPLQVHGLFVFVLEMG